MSALRTILAAAVRAAGWSILIVSDASSGIGRAAFAAAAAGYSVVTSLGWLADRIRGPP